MKDAETLREEVRKELDVMEEDEQVVLYFQLMDFPFITRSTTQDFRLITSNDEFNITDSRVITFDDSVSAIRFVTRESMFAI